MQSFRLSLLLVVVIGALFGTAGSAAADYRFPQGGSEYAGGFPGADVSPLTSRQECQGLCVFDQRGWKSTEVEAHADGSTGSWAPTGSSGAEPWTRGIEIKCDPASFKFATYQFDERLAGYATRGGGTTVGSLQNYSSVINRCSFPINLVAADGRQAKVRPGQSIFDLGASPWRMNDRVVNVVGPGSRLGQP